MKKFFLLTVLFLLASINPINTLAGAYSPQVTIKSIRALASGGFDVKTNEVVNAACTNNGQFFRVQSGQHNMTAEGVKTALGVSLTAFGTGKAIVTFVDTSSVYCHASLVQIES